MFFFNKIKKKCCVFNVVFKKQVYMILFIFVEIKDKTMSVASVNTHQNVEQSSCVGTQQII